MRGGGMRGGMGGGRGGMRGGAGGRTGRAGQQVGGLARPGAPGAAEGKVFTMRSLRLVLFTDRGMMIVAENVPVGALAEDKRGWTPVAVPLSRFQGVEEATTVHAVGVFADESDVFYLGRIGLLVDRTPVEIAVEASPLMARPDEIIDFSASLRGGPINPFITWDFDKSNGIQEQAIGAEVQYLYKAPGDYLVTCTVSDRDGVRSPVKKGIGIKVEGPA